MAVLKLPVSDHWILPLMASVYWIFCNSSEFEVEILFYVSQKSLLEPVICLDWHGFIMKFAEHLSAHITPEWRKQYISYEVGLWNMLNQYVFVLKYFASC
jgi:hypothetical protein